VIGEPATIIAGMTTSRIATHGAGEGPIFGREHELSQLYELVDRVHERGAALLVRGEPGIGKSTLLAAACRRAEDAGMQVLRTTGVQSEAQLPFAGLHQLVLPILGRVDRLPTPQQAALLAAFGMVEAAEAPDRFLIALAVLELLSDAAERAGAGCGRGRALVGSLHCRRASLRRTSSRARAARPARGNPRGRGELFR
jgi:hypothetical protein